MIHKVDHSDRLDNRILSWSIVADRAATTLDAYLCALVEKVLILEMLEAGIAFDFVLGAWDVRCTGSLLVDGGSIGFFAFLADFFALLEN